MPVSIYPNRGGSSQNVPDPIHSFGSSTPAATDRDGICAAQQRTGAGNLTLNGAGVSGGSYSCGFDGGRLITVYSAGNLSARTFTITGTDKDGVSQNETITGPNATTATGTKYFQTVTQVAVDDTIGSDAEVGFAASLVVLNTSRGSVFKLAPTSGESVKIAIYGSTSTELSHGVSLKLDCPASLTLTWADGTTPTDTRIYFPGGTEPTPTASGTDWFTFVNDGTTASGDAVWYGFIAGQDLKA